ncbi:hypothetical protein MO973_24225 [Paenibacillus sp. TRM 82003]|nr:hypothetical protein [Paenibacillus sp. TRM 82003]
MNTTVSIDRSPARRSELPDHVLGGAILAELKAAAIAYTEAALDAASPDTRRIFERLAGDSARRYEQLLAILQQNRLAAADYAAPPQELQREAQRASATARAVSTYAQRGERTGRDGAPAAASRGGANVGVTAAKAEFTPISAQERGYMPLQQQQHGYWQPQQQQRQARGFAPQQGRETSGSFGHAGSFGAAMERPASAAPAYDGPRTTTQAYGGYAGSPSRTAEGSSSQPFVGTDGQRGVAGPQSQAASIYGQPVQSTGGMNSSSFYGHSVAPQPMRLPNFSPYLNGLPRQQQMPFAAVPPYGAAPDGREHTASAPPEFALPHAMPFGGVPSSAYVPPQPEVKAQPADSEEATASTTADAAPDASNPAAKTTAQTAADDASSRESASKTAARSKPVSKPSEPAKNAAAADSGDAEKNASASAPSAAAPKRAGRRGKTSAASAAAAAAVEAAEVSGEAEQLTT